MGDALVSEAVVSEAGRALSRARWGSSHVRRLVDELVQRIAEVDEVEADRLRAALAEAEQQREAVG